MSKNFNCISYLCTNKKLKQYRLRDQLLPQKTAGKTCKTVEQKIKDYAAFLYLYLFFFTFICAKSNNFYTYHRHRVAFPRLSSWLIDANESAGVTAPLLVRNVVKFLEFRTQLSRSLRLFTQFSPFDIFPIYIAISQFANGRLYWFSFLVTFLTRTRQRRLLQIHLPIPFNYAPHPPCQPKMQIHNQLFHHIVCLQTR